MRKEEYNKEKHDYVIVYFDSNGVKHIAPPIYEVMKEQPKGGRKNEKG